MERKTEAPTDETTADMVEHEIEELERPVWRESRIHPFFVVVGAAVIVAALSLAVLVATKYTSMTDQSQSRSRIVQIEPHEPRSGALDDRPTKFSWDSVARTREYVLSIREKDGASDLVVKHTASPVAELTAEETARFVRGGRYIWRVQARSGDGWTLGEGGSSFSM